MATEWISPTWRMPNDKNQSKFENYSLDFAGASLEHVMLGNGGNDTDLLPGQPTVAGTVNNPNFSVSAFFNFDSAISGSLRNIIGAGQTGGAMYWYLRKNASDNIEFIVRNEVGSPYYVTVTGSTVLNSDQWYHAAVSWNGTTITLYLDGTSEATAAATTFYFGGGPGTEWPTIGSYYRGATTQTSLWDGKIAQPCIFDYALSQGQVDYLYNSGTPINPMAISGQPPVAYYPLGGSSTGSASTLTVPNESVADATVFNFVSADGDRIIIEDTGTGTGVVNGLNGAMTASIWMNTTVGTVYQWVFTRDRGGGTNRDWYIWKDNFYGGGDRMMFGVFNTSNVALSIRITGSTDPQGDPIIPVNDGKWHHIVGVYNGTDTVELYTDGVLQGTNTSAGHGAINTTSRVAIGGVNNGSLIGSGYGSFNGDLSNAQIWNTNLSSAEVVTLYNNGVPLLTGTQPEAANLKAWYPMNVENANWLGSDWQIADAVSAYPQSFNFDKTIDEYIRAPKQSFFDTGNKSASLWVRPKTSHTGYIYDCRGTSTGAGFTILGTNNGGTGKFRLYVMVNTLTKRILTGYQSSLDIEYNKWTNVAWTFDEAAETLKVYINGIYKYTLTTTATGTYNAANDLEIGRPYNTGGNDFDGDISNLMIWNEKLSDGGVALNDPATGQIAELYNNGSPLTTAIASSNLKAWYKLNNTANWNTTTDKWYITNSGLTTNYSSALKFIPKSDGSGNALTIYQGTDGNGPANLKFGATDSFSISTWVYVENKNSLGNIFTARGSFATGAKSFNRLTINTLGASRSDQQVAWTVRDDNNVSSGVSSTLSTSGHPEDFNWTHIVGVVDRSAQTIQLFINGKGSSTASMSSLGGFENQDSIVIGDDGFTAIGGRNYYDGQLSNFAIFGSALSQSEINTLYNNGTPEASISYSPISWWKLDNLTTGIEDSGGGGNNITAASWITQVSNDVMVDAMSSGMTESNLVNNNVSALNGTSLGMTTANLVNSDLTRSIPYSSYSMAFDGVNDYIQLASSSTAIVDWTQPYSISLWVKYSTPLSWDLIATFGIETGSASTTRYIMIGGNSGYLFTGVGDTNGGTTNIHFNIGSGLDQGDWHHLVYVGDGSSGDFPSVYIDGVLEPYSGGTTNLYNNSTYLNVIGTGSTATGRYFSGKISNVSTFNKALTSTEIIKLYNGGVPNSISSLSPVSWWSLAGDSYFNGSDWICPDLGSGGNNGTSSGMGGSELVGDAPGGSANGTATNMDIPANLKGDAPNSSSNVFSVNMDTADRVASVPS